MQLQIFKYQSEEEQAFSSVRSFEDEDGKIWFCAKDVAELLGYANPRDAILKHCKSERVAKRDVMFEHIQDNNIKVKRPVQMNFIDEGNVYRLIVNSRLPNAEKFEKWIFDEVIPSIRQKGYYGKIDRTALPNFIERYKDNYHKLPNDYFSVISEMYVRLYMALEKVGYAIPDRGETGKQMMPDISVGRGFATFLKRNNSEFFGQHKTYRHTFPDGREVDANMYHIDALPMFIRYLNEDWIPNKAEQYFRERDPLALDYLPKLLTQKDVK